MRQKPYGYAPDTLKEYVTIVTAHQRYSLTTQILSY